jgi:hypothetical protein
MAPRRGPVGISDPGAHSPVDGHSTERPDRARCFPALYLQDNASIEVGKPFRGYAATIWIDKGGEIRTGFDQASLNFDARYLYAQVYFLRH